MTNKKYLSIDKNAQSAVIGWILKEKEFAYNCKMHLKAEMFIDVFLQKIFTKIIDFLNEYKNCPSLDNLCNLFYADKEHEGASHQ